ncbi:MAG: hypothetical protein ACC631_03525 [Halocynthiibacter sp.]
MSTDPRFTSTFFTILVLAWMPITASADDCSACTELDGLRALQGMAEITRAAPGAAQRAPVTFTIGGGNFCGGEKPAALATEVDALTDRIFSRAEDVAIQVQNCAPGCAPAADGDKLCRLGNALLTDGTYLNRLGDGLAAGALIFESAAKSGRSASAEIIAQLSLYASETVDLLKQGLVALRDNDVRKLSPDSWSVNGKDITEIGQALSLMAEFGLTTGDAAGPAESIRIAGDEMALLGGDINQELTRARVTEPADRAALAARILLLADNLSWAIASAHQSAETGEETTISTVANAVPNAARSTGYTDAGRCFTKLSLSAVVASEGMTITRDLLNECRPIAGCATSDTGANPGPLTLTAFLGRQAKSSKALRTMAAMCKVN